jgi:hypothetical protein
MIKITLGSSSNLNFGGSNMEQIICGTFAGWRIQTERMTPDKRGIIADFNKKEAVIDFLISNIHLSPLLFFSKFIIGNKIVEVQTGSNLTHRVGLPAYKTGSGWVVGTPPTIH